LKKKYFELNNKVAKLYTSDSKNNSAKSLYAIGKLDSSFNVPNILKLNYDNSGGVKQRPRSNSNSIILINYNII